MYWLFLGKISLLSGGQLPPAVAALAPSGPRHAGWLAGRVLLSRAISPLPEIVFGAQGKPAFPAGSARWFNLSHSGDEIALLLSDEGDVGCDIEVIRARKNWPALAESQFTPAEQAHLAAIASEHQLAAFWRIWTRKEAIIKQRGGSIWQMASVNSAHCDGLYIADIQVDNLSIAVCTPTPCHLDTIIHLSH